MNHFLTRKGVVDHSHWEMFFFPDFLPNSALEPYLLDQGPLTQKLVGDFQTFGRIFQWLELLNRKDEKGIIYFWLFLSISGNNLFDQIHIFRSYFLVQLCRHDAVIFFTGFFQGHRRKTVSVSVFSFSLQWIQLNFGHVEIRELFGRLGLADSAGWLRSESHGLARRHGLEDHGLEPPAPEG